MIFDDVLDLAKKVSKYTIAGEGNVSIRDGDTMLIKASGSTLETMTDEDLVRCNLDGNALDDEKKKPSMEVSFHAWILKSFPEIKCVCHTHPTNTNKILCSGDIIDFANNNLHVPTEKGEYGPAEDVHMIIAGMVGSFLIRYVQAEN